MAVRSRLSLLTPLLAAFALVGCAGDGGGIQSQKLSAVKARDKLICGVEG